MRVLVVSEDATERSRAVSAIELQATADVTEVSTAGRARELILHEGERYDVLVVDGDLSPRGGFALLYDLRSHAELDGTPPMPSVVMAAREADRWLAKWSGTASVLLKPVDPFELAGVVRSLDGAQVPGYGDAASAADQVAAALRGER